MGWPLLLLSLQKSVGQTQLLQRDPNNNTNPYVNSCVVALSWMAITEYSGLKWGPEKFTDSLKVCEQIGKSWVWKGLQSLINHYFCPGWLA